MKNVLHQEIEKLPEFNFRWDPETRRHVPPSDFKHFFTVGTPVASVTGEDVRRVLTVAKKIGNKNVFYVASEVFGGEDFDEVHKLFSVDEASQLIEHHFIRRKGTEFYLIAEDQKWVVWAFHEPCMHIASKNQFVEVFKSTYPDSPICDPRWDDCFSKWQGMNES